MMYRLIYETPDGRDRIDMGKVDKSMGSGDEWVLEIAAIIAGMKVHPDDGRLILERREWVERATVTI